MQRQLAALCALPAALQKSLAAVNEKICRLLPPEPEIEVSALRQPLRVLRTKSWEVYKN